MRARMSTMMGAMLVAAGLFAGCGDAGLYIVGKDGLLLELLYTGRF